MRIETGASPWQAAARRSRALNIPIKIYLRGFQKDNSLCSDGKQDADRDVIVMRIVCAKNPPSRTRGAYCA